MLTLLLVAAAAATLPPPASVVPAPNPGLPAPAIRVTPTPTVSPYGPDWQWDAARREWFRYGPAVATQPLQSLQQYQPVPSFVYPAYQPTLQAAPQFVPSQQPQPYCPTGNCPWRR